MGPLRYQNKVTIGPIGERATKNIGLLGFIKGIFAP
jgi:hypothetical protein